MNHFSSPICLLLLSFCISGCTTSQVGRGIIERTESFMSGGRRIEVETFAPSTTGRYPTVLVLHSSAGMILGKSALVDLCRKLAAQGKMAMLVHYFDRTDTHWGSRAAIAKLWPIWAETVEDAMNQAAADPRVRPDSIGVFGYSLGAFLAVAVASKDKRVVAVVEVSGGIFDALKGKLKRVPPTLILHGKSDQVVSLSYALALAEAARKLGRPVSEKLYDGEGHVLSKQAMSDAMMLSLKFFDMHLPENQLELQNAN